MKRNKEDIVKDKLLRFSIVLLLLSIFTNLNCYGFEKEKNDISYEIRMKQDLLSLMIAYPSYIVDIEKDSNDLVYIVMKSGKKILYDDKIEKGHGEKITNPDLQDMLEEIYPLDSIDSVLKEKIDPGRIRVYGLLNEVYGSNLEEINKNLISVNTYYGILPFNKQNGASDNLKKVMKEISEVAKGNGSILQFLLPISGTFNYRTIQDTGRLSAHAYGIAIDLNRSDSDYWKWASEDEGTKRIASYSKELVKIFEDNGFIWGGKWKHFDILHFEYRPEFIIKSKYFNNGDNYTESNWQGSIPANEDTNKFIDLINSKV
ncbi:M15 family metallopeptidase [Clostridium sp.]|uniref:M15 family metallopeptidase n=1 Tax=Clostridium sp. TaxID=1506 RepID=UPI003F34D62B